MQTSHFSSSFLTLYGLPAQASVWSKQMNSLAILIGFYRKCVLTIAKTCEVA